MKYEWKEGILPAVERWFDGAKKILDEYMSREFPRNPKESLKFTIGPQGSQRYIRVTRITEGHIGGSAWAFVDLTTGDVLKPASWAAPAKHARGNVFDEFNGLKSVGPYGPGYLRR